MKISVTIVLESAEKEENKKMLKEVTKKGVFLPYLSAK
jgi:hypothetical protein